MEESLWSQCQLYRTPLIVVKSAAFYTLLLWAKHPVAASLRLASQPIVHHTSELKTAWSHREQPVVFHYKTFFPQRKRNTIDFVVSLNFAFIWLQHFLHLASTLPSLSFNIAFIWLQHCLHLASTLPSFGFNFTFIKLQHCLQLASTLPSFGFNFAFIRLFSSVLSVLADFIFLIDFTACSYSCPQIIKGYRHIAEKWKIIWKVLIQIQKPLLTGSIL